MGLSDMDTDNDRIVKQKAADFTTRKKLQSQVMKTTIAEKPEGPALWATDKVVVDTGIINKCNMQVTVATVSATVPNGNTDGTDIDDIPKETFIPMKLAGEWSLEKLFYTNSNPEKPHKGVYLAAPVNHYGFQDYWMHVPSNIRNAIPAFIQKFLEKYAGGYTPGVLKAEHVSVAFHSFKCNLKLGDQDDITEHFEDVHGVKGGPTKLNPFREITVNAALPFEIQKLGDIENFGDDKKLETVRSLFVYCQSRDVVSKTNDKSEAFLKEERSKEFMISLSKSCSDIFFSRVEEHIRDKIKKDVTESFSCKWVIIEEAILNAVGREHNITKVDCFIDKDGTDFHGAPLDILFSRISHYVDGMCGTSTSTFQDSKYRTLSEYTFSTKWKYTLIIRLVRSLPSNFASVKEHIRQEAADIFCNIKQLKDIGDFIKDLKTFFTTNGHLQQFTTNVVPPPTKKNLSANTTGMEEKPKAEDPEKQKKFSELFNKTKVEKTVDDKFKKSLIVELSKICTDANSSTALGSLQEFKDFCKKNNQQACFCCISINCFKKQKAGREAKMKKKISNKLCPKKQLTLGEVKAMTINKDTPKADEGTSVGATAAIFENESQELEFSAIMAEVDMSDDGDDSTFIANMAEIEVVQPQNDSITIEKLQTRFQYWSSSDPKQMRIDKTCIICHKRYMTWPRYSDHLEIAHGLYQYEDDLTYMKLSEIIYTRNQWLEEELPSPNPRYYDSVNEEEISEFESASDESSDDEGPPKQIKLAARMKREDSSSSDSASESEDCQSDSSVKSRSSRSRQQVGRKIKMYLSSMKLSMKTLEILKVD